MDSGGVWAVLTPRYSINSLTGKMDRWFAPDIIFRLKKQAYASTGKQTISGFVLVIESCAAKYRGSGISAARVPPLAAPPCTAGPSGQR